jgi:hypothetical protein
MMAVDAGTWGQIATVVGIVLSVGIIYFLEAAEQDDE